MKQNKLTAIVCITLFFIYGNCLAQTAANPGLLTIRKAIENTNALYFNLFAKKDGAIVDLYTDDACLLSPNMLPISGKKALKKDFEDTFADGKVKAPIVIGRDHLDCGSVASPNRETEGMIDGSDAIADWPILNALLNAIGGASWVSVHHGGGVGMGKSIHAGMVIVADGTKEAEARLERVLTYDPGMGIIRHADAGYEQAIDNAKKWNVKIPMIK